MDDRWFRLCDSGRLKTPFSPCVESVLLAAAPRSRTRLGCIVESVEAFGENHVGVFRIQTPTRCNGRNRSCSDGAKNGTGKK